MVAASKPTSRLSLYGHFLCPLSVGLGTLADGLGYLPLDDGAYPPPSYSQDTADGIRSLKGWGTANRPPILSVSLPPSAIT